MQKEIRLGDSLGSDGYMHRLIARELPDGDIMLEHGIGNAELFRKRARDGRLLWAATILTRKQIARVAGEFPVISK